MLYEKELLVPVFMSLQPVVARRFARARDTNDWSDMVVYSEILSLAASDMQPFRATSF